MVRVYGINPVLEALRARRVTSVLVASVTNNRIGAAVRLADSQRVPIRRTSAQELDRVTHGAAHQGIVATVDDAGRLGVEDLVDSSRVPLIVVLDGIEDPHNLGAILRSIDAAGASGLVRQSRHAAPLGGAAAKVSAGASAHVRVAEVVNIARTLEALKEMGVWTVGLAADSQKSLYDLDLTLPTAVVVGAEGTGLRRLVRERCDWIAAIPMAGHVQSLNVSVATAVVLFEAVRQRRLGLDSTE